MYNFRRRIPVYNNDDRFLGGLIGGAFLGGLTGGLVAPIFYPRPVMYPVYNGYNQYPTFY